LEKLGKRLENIGKLKKIYMGKYRWNITKYWQISENIGEYQKISAKYRFWIYHNILRWYDCHHGNLVIYGDISDIIGINVTIESCHQADD